MGQFCNSGFAKETAGGIVPAAGRFGTAVMEF